MKRHPVIYVVAAIVVWFAVATASYGFPDFDPPPTKYPPGFVTRKPLSIEDRVENCERDLRAIRLHVHKLEDDSRRIELKLAWLVKLLQVGEQETKP